VLNLSSKSRMWFFVKNRVGYFSIIIINAKVSEYVCVSKNSDGNHGCTGDTFHIPLDDLPRLPLPTKYQYTIIIIIIIITIRSRRTVAWRRGVVTFGH